MFLQLVRKNRQKKNKKIKEKEKEKESKESGLVCELQESSRLGQSRVWCGRSSSRSYRVDD